MFSSMRKHCTPKFAMAVIVTAFGGSLQQGYNLACLNAPAKHIIDWTEHIFDGTQTGSINCSELHQANVSIQSSHHHCEKNVGSAVHNRPNDIYYSFLVSIYLLGGMFGGVMSGTIGDTFGRKRSILYNNALLFVGTTLNVFSYYLNFAGYWTFLLGRFITGVNTGLSSGLVPTYLIEISPLPIRSLITASLRLFLTFGFFLAALTGIIFGKCDSWNIIFVFSYLPIIVSIVLMPFCPESPKFLLKIKKLEKEVENTIRSIRPSTHDVNKELDSLREDTTREERDQISFIGIFRKPYRWPLILCVSMTAAQQFVGIGAVNYYSTKIFQNDAGFSDIGSKYATAGLMLVNVIGSIFALWLVNHPRIGRRFMFLAGLTGCCLVMFLLFFLLKLLDCSDPSFPRSPTNYFAIGLLVLFTIFYNVGPSPVLWVILSESFHSYSRPKAAAVSSSSNWFFNFAIGLLFNPLKNAIGVYVFLPLVVFSGSLIFFLFLFLAETKNKTVEQLECEWADGILACKTRIQSRHHSLTTSTMKGKNEDSSTASTMRDPMIQETLKTMREAVRI